MAETHVVSALTAKRAELAGEIELATVRLQRLRAALHSLDETLCLFDPSAVPDAIETKVWRPKADWAQRGEMMRTCLDTLRQASEPLSTRDIALVLMTARGMETDNERLVKLISKRVGTCLRGQRDQGRAPCPSKGRGKRSYGGSKVIDKPIGPKHSTAKKRPAP